MWVLILAGRVIMCTVPECYNYGDCAQDSGDQDQRCGVRGDWSFTVISPQQSYYVVNTRAVNAHLCEVSQGLEKALEKAFSLLKAFSRLLCLWRL